MFGLFRLIVKAAIFIALVTWLTSCAKSPVSLAIMNPVTGFVVDDCDEFAPTRSAQRLCAIKDWTLRGITGPDGAAQPGRQQPYVCRRTLAKPECLAVSAASAE